MMNSKQLDSNSIRKVRQRFEKSVNLVRNSDYNSLQNSLVDLWQFFDEEPVLRKIKDNLIANFPNLSDDVFQVLNSPGSDSNKKQRPRLEQVAIAISVLQEVAKVAENWFRNSLIVSVHPATFELMPQNEKDNNYAEVFKNKYLNKFETYIEEQLDEIEFQNLDYEPTINIVPQTLIDFSFVSNGEIREIIERDYSELQNLNPKQHSKSVLVLSGGLIEGILIDALVKAGKWTLEEIQQRVLKDLIHPAKNSGIISHDNLTDLIRNYRNLVHPMKEIKEKIKFTEQHSIQARASLDVVIQEVRIWHSNLP